MLLLIIIQRIFFFDFLGVDWSSIIWGGGIFDVFGMAFFNVLGSLDGMVEASWGVFWTLLAPR